jgi:hypothetical protein
VRSLQEPTVLRRIAQENQGRRGRKNLRVRRGRSPAGSRLEKSASPESGLMSGPYSSAEASDAAAGALVHRLAYNGDVVAFKMGRRQGGPSRTGGRERISQSIRNRRATQPPAHFQRDPPDRGRLAVFPPPRRIDPYESRYGRFTASPVRTALKNNQLTCGDITIVCETVH